MKLEVTRVEVWIASMKDTPGALAAAKKVGFKKGKRLFTICVTGPNKAGVGSAITEAIGAAGLTMQGFSAHVIGRKFVLHIAFATSAAATKASRILRKL